MVRRTPFRLYVSVSLAGAILSVINFLPPLPPTTARSISAAAFSRVLIHISNSFPSPVRPLINGSQSADGRADGRTY